MEITHLEKAIASENLNTAFHKKIAIYRTYLLQIH